MRLTVIVLNWKREYNVHKICASLSKNSIVQSVYVWNNGFASSFKSVAWPNVTLIESGMNFGVLARFSLAMLAMTDCILIQDDDVLLAPNTINQLAEQWCKQPKIVHGLYGRIPDSAGNYADFRDRDNCEVEMVCGRVMMFSRSLLPHFWRWWYYSEIQHVRKGAILLNLGTHADDIVLSYCAMSLNHRKNQVHHFHRIELSEGEEALCSKLEHWAVRNEMMIVCRRLAGAQYIL